MTDSPSLLQQAASGSVSAQSELVDLTLHHGNIGTIKPIEALAVAEVWARMAASQGRIEDIRRLGGVLLLRAGYEREHGDPRAAAHLDAEALWAFEFAANHGDEDAAIAIVSAAETIPAASMKLLPRGYHPIDTEFAGEPH